MNDYLSAILIGLTYGNLWVCALLVFSLQTTKHHTSIGFLLGRTVSVFILATIISFLGRMLQIPYYILHIISGCIIIFYSIYIIVKYLISKKSKKNKHQLQCNSSHDCQHCIVHDKQEYSKYCDDCNTDCLYESNEFKFIDKNSKKSGFWLGFGIGALRGGVLCSKLLILAPILTKATFSKSIIISFLFILSSSIYPILGIFIGKIALKFVKIKRILFTFSCFALLFLGGYYIYQGCAIIVSNM